MSSTKPQISLRFSPTPEPEPAPDAVTSRSHEPRLGLLLDQREWLELLADEWWLASATDRIVRLGVNTPLRLPFPQDRSAVTAWIDPGRLPPIDVFTFRGGQWVEISLRDITAADQEIAWPGPIPLFAVSTFSVATTTDRARVLAMAKGFSNLEVPSQRIDIEPLHGVPPAAQQSPAIPILQPPHAWNALRGAAAMAVWSVPAIPPWLDVLRDSLADPSEGAAALRVDAP